jgi:hypothetical protein
MSSRFITTVRESHDEEEQHGILRPVYDAYYTVRMVRFRSIDAVIRDAGAVLGTSNAIFPTDRSWSMADAPSTVGIIE